MTTLYKPHETGEVLIGDDGSIIEPTPFLFFSDNKPMLHFWDGGRPEVRDRFYRAVRLEKAASVENVHWSPELFNDPPTQIEEISRTPLLSEPLPVTIEKTRARFRAGTLLIRTIEEGSFPEEPKWYAYSRIQEGWQKLQRRCYDPFKGISVLARDFTEAERGCASVHRISLMYNRAGQFPDPEQAAAHVTDIDLMVELGLLDPKS